MVNAAGESRGFELNHQRVVLDVDFAGYVKATTYITIRPTNARLSTVLLHAASNIRITSCKLQGPEKYDPLPEVPATYIHHDPFEQLQPPGESSANIIQSHPEIKRRIWSAMSEKEEGELEIDVSHGWVRIAKARSEDTHTQMRLAEIMITIEYEIVMSELDTEGFVFRRPGDSGFDERVPHIFVNQGSFNSARHWVPCLDNLWDRCPWELEIIVPRTLAQEVETGDERDEGGAIQELPVTVIASAELEEQVIHPEDSTKAIFYFAQSALSSAQQISFAIGPFSLYVIRADNETKRIMDGEDITESLVLAYCLPGMELQLQNTTSWMRKAMDFFEEYDVYPYTSFKMVFVEDPAIESALSAGMAVFSQSLLYPPEILEQAYVTRPILSFALASQWSGLSIIPKAYSDSWLVDGIALYLNAQLTRKLLGDNEYRYRLRCDIERCVTMDQGDQYPICVPGTLGPVDRPTLQFIHLKAPLVLHILDKRMGKLGTTSALARSVIPEIFRQARADSLAGRQLATEHFFRICKKTTRSLDVIAFQNQWVLGSGCPRFAVRAEYVKRMGKQGYLNLSVYQPPSQAFRVISDKEVNNLEWKAPTEYFTGDLTVHVYDGDEAPFEHIVDVVAEGRIYELPYTANPKRVYRNRSSRRTGRIKAEESQNGAVVNDTEMSEERREALEWKFMNWSQDDMEKLFAQGFDWIRYDPDVEWIAIFERQKDAPGAAHLESNAIVWATQLQSEKDVIAQKEAIDNLCATPLPICSTILTRTVLDDSYFYRIRMHAAESLLRFHLTVDDCSSIGFFHLQKVYRSRYCKASTEELDHLIASIPDPSDLPELMLRQVILRGLCLHPGLELNEGIRKMRDHLVQLLIYDVAPNSPFSLVFYKTALVASLAAVMRKQTPPQRTAVGFQTAVSVLDRILVMDRLMPSYGNLISIAGLQAKLVVALSDRTLLPHNIPFFLAYIRQGNEPALRRTAYDCVLACQPPAQWLVKHIRMLLKRDPSLDFRRHIAQGLADSWLMAFAFGEMDGLHDPTATDKTREMLQRDPDAFLDGDIAHMRQAMSTSEDLRRVISSLIVDSKIDISMRIALLQSAQLITSAKEVKLVLKVGASAKTKNAAASKSRTSASVKANLREDSANINKKKKKTHKALANGLSEEVFKAGKIIVDRLISANYSAWFRDPVPHDEPYAERYYKMISQPMNLKEVKAKLHDGFYKNKDEVKRDLYLIASNAKAFNQPGEPVWQLADTYEKNLTTMWQTADKTLENKQGKKETPTDVKPEATAPTLKFKVNTALATPAVSVEKGNQRLTNTAVPPHDLAKTEAPRSKNTRRKRDAPDALDDELLGLTEESPRPVITPLAPEPKLKKVKLAFNQPALSSDASERPPGVKNSGRPIHALPSKPVSNSVSSTLAPGAGSPAVSQFLERKVKLSTSQRPSSVPSGTHTPHAPTPPPPTVSVPPTTSPVPPAGSNALVSALWRELPGVHLPIRKLRVQKYLHDITKEPIFAPFKVPVTEDIAPGYRKIITSPMDVTKMLRKLEKGEYRTMGDVAKDVEQIIWNCRKYNGIDSFPDREWATPFERKALDTWPRLVDTRLITDEKRLIITWMERTAKSDNGIWFARPVDPVADGVPDYYEFVKKEDARDLRTIRETLQRTKDNSITLESLDADIYLMIENAQKYNPPGSVVYNAATEVGKRWDQMRLDIEPGRRGRFLGTNEGRR